jgi:isopentenyl phosphate kinase
MSELYFLKLGGSLLTDKKGVEALRAQVLDRLAREIRVAMQERAQLRLVIGHGSGSFGHVAAARYGTRQGVRDRADWRGFAEVSAAAARLNRLVREALLAAGVPVLSLQPSASAICEDGRLCELAVEPVERALEAGLVPLLYGDVAFDKVRGGTIISTEQILSYLASLLKPSWLLLAGDTSGVYDSNGQVISSITRQNYSEVETVLRGSRGTDVTGGMASKVQQMLSLAENQDGLTISIFSGMEEGRLRRALLDPEQGMGTTIQR